MIDHDCATTIGGTSRTYDILGNTLTMGATKSMGWDVLNRMTSYTNSGATTTYAYRADGLRVKKTGAGASPTTTYYRYDGQMPVEEFNYRIVYPISYIKILRYALGARGIDRIERIPTNGATLVGYPLYDAHGNNIATLTIDHANHFSVPASDKRSYGPWGDIRTGSTTGEPQPRHCANLGHLSDDESGFVYMHARYYEPGSGRFVSEDPGRSGGNRFGYCANDPINSIDRSGKNAESERLQLIGAVLKLIGFFFMTGGLSWEYAELPAALAQIIELGGEFNAAADLEKILSTGVEASNWERFRDAARLFKDAMLYKKNFNAPRGIAGGALLALLGYDIYLRGELYQQAAFDAE